MGRLREPGRKGPLTALGAMSGTSLDGVDAAVLTTDGQAILEIGPVGYRPYSDAERRVLRAALGQWQGSAVARAAAVVELAHAELLGGFEGVDIVGFHGQTLAHDPQGRGTLQAGDGQVLSEALNLPVVWDFRSTDVAMGGEGAPLAPFYHFACARWIGARGPVCFLNLGGVGNLTWIDPRLPAPEAEGACLAFDTGPANAPINDLLAARRGQAFDRDGTLAAAGEIDDDVLARLVAAPYIQRHPPKSLDRDDFGWLQRAVAHLDDADAAATLTAAAAAAVAEAMVHLPQPPERLLLTGGGRHNPVMVAFLEGMVSVPVSPVEDVGLDGDMLEAQAFAFLAVRVARGLPTSAPGTTGVRAPVGGGQYSRPGGQRHP